MAPTDTGTPAFLFLREPGALSLAPFLPSLPETDALVLWVKISHPWKSVPCPGCLLSFIFLQACSWEVAHTEMSTPQGRGQTCTRDPGSRPTEV